MSDNDLDDYEYLAREFLKVIFDLDYDDCIISDRSSLSDFVSVNGDVVRKVYDFHGVLIRKNEHLVDVFEQIRHQIQQNRS